MSQQAMASLVDAINALPNPYPPVSLIKHYKGTTLNQQGRIVTIDPDSATIKATQRLTFPFLDGVIHLRSGAFPGAITANIHPVEYSHGTFQLSDLSYSGWRERKVERVQPKCPTYISMSFRGRTYRAFLEDICTEGIGILANANIDLAGRLGIGIKPLLEFQLAPEYVFINLEGAIRYRQSVGRQLIKFGLSLFPDSDQKISLREYVTQRRAEILDELQDDYIRMRQACRVENLYF